MEVRISNVDALSELTRHQRRNTQSTDPDTALVYEGFLASSCKPTAEEMNPSGKAAKRIWRQWSKLSLEDEATASPKRLVVLGSLIQTDLQELHEQLGNVGTKIWWRPCANDTSGSLLPRTSVHSDQSPNFESRNLIELCKTFGIAKTHTAPGHLQGNEQVKRTIRTLIGLLKDFVKEA
ncbi:unnamed protein product [Taenia asiatica]|uniref:Integrase catalytic domain-containing protein n=1 Tax=Taenia asiatica TaxID=60517 RepID=A0A0R3WD81_TAEAS|nr:unnamed protein product [Taenia asiatica]